MNRLIWLTVLLVGCFKPRGPVIHVMDPETVVMIARTRAIPPTLRARFSIRISTPERSATIPGSLLLQHPDHLRAEVYTPFGTPLLYLVSDGEGLHAWDQRQQVFYQGDYAGMVLQNLTGGAVGLEDLLSVFMARLPMPDSEILHTGRTVFEDGGVELMLMGPDEMSIRSVVHPSTGVLLRLQVWEGAAESDLTHAAGGMILDVEYEGELRIGRVRLPERVVMSLPQIGWKVTINYRSWSAVDVDPGVFQLAPPPGSRVMDMAEALQQAAERNDKRHAQ